MTDRVLDVKNLSIDIPLAEGMLHAVDGIDIHVDKGETLCIVGESGCGKSLTSPVPVFLIIPNNKCPIFAAARWG